MRKKERQRHNLYGACYLCRMKKMILTIILGVSLCAMPAQAQFNTIASVPNRYKVEVLRKGTDKAEPTPAGMVPAQGAPANIPASASPVESHKEIWVGRYLSVSYPLQQIKINSSYGYRKDPFTGKRKFHNGIDLHARGDEVLAMMKGVVVKVGQDKTSGKYVTLQHGSYTVSYCHLSKVLVGKGTTVRPRDVVGITGSTGRSTGEHLHITCKLGGKNVDPLLVLDYIKSIQKECVAALSGL